MVMVLRVSILEPDPEIRELLTRQLQHLGHEVITEDKPDVVLVEPASERALHDLAMLRHPDLRVVCISIYPQREGTADVGAAAYLIKPVSLGQLDSAIGRVRLPSPVVELD
jgi:hypothetical protein